MPLARKSKPAKSNETRKLTRRVAASSRSRSAKQSRLAYGDLEKRLALTTFIVTTASDNSSGVEDGFVSLREAIVAANTNAAFGDAPAGEADGDLIRFDPSVYNTTMSLSLGQISISDDVLIQGGPSNVTIEGNGNTRLFDITASERVGFSKLTFSEGNAPIGGAISAIGSGTTLLFETTFSDNTASGTGGGALYFANGNMFLTNTSFNSNRANGTTGSGGAILSVSGNIYATDGAMTSNFANASGGAIAITGGTFFSIGLDVGSTDGGNVAGPIGAANPGDGGGLHVSGTGRVTVQAGSFVGNLAARNGGGMWAGGSANLFVRPDAAVTNNSAIGDLVGNGGGGIYNDGANVFINRATINSNSASGTSGSGGAIYSDGGKIVANLATIESNAARRTGGGIHIVDGFLQLTNASVANNDVGTTFVSATSLGGGIYAAGSSSVVVSDGVVSNNTAILRGGGIWAGPSTLVFLRNTASVSFNKLSDSASIGGGMFTSGYLQATDAFFQRNEAETTGGGLYINDAARARIDKTTFFENDGGNQGGGIFNNGFMYVTDSVFQSNTVTNSGGAYFKTPTSSTLVSGLSFTGNIPNNFN